MRCSCILDIVQYWKLKDTYYYDRLMLYLGGQILFEEIN